MNAATTTTTAITATISALHSALNNVTVSQVEAVKTALKGVSLEGALAAYTKNESKGLAIVGAYAHVFQGVAQCLCYGNSQTLQGLAVSSKKTSAAYAALVSLGVVSDAGELLAGLDKASEKKASYGALMARQIEFVAYLWAARAAAAEAKKASAEATAEAKKASAEATAEAPGPLLSLGQEQATATAVALILSQLKAGTLAEECAAQLRSALQMEPEPALI